MNLKEIIRKIEELEKMFCDKMDSHLETIKEVEGVKRINNQCFTVNFASLNNMNLSYEYYDSKKQITLLKEKLKKCNNVESIKNKIEEYLKKKTLEVNKGYQIQLHPIVLEKLNEVYLEM